MSFTYSRRLAACATAFAVVAAPLIASPALADTGGTGIVINEIYGAGGNSGAVLDADYVELYNPSGDDVSLAGWSLQYRSATSSGPASGTNIVSLRGTIPAGGTYLVTGPSGKNGDPVVGDVAGGFAASATAGQFVLAKTTAAIALGAETDAATVADFVGFGTTANRFEGQNGPAPAPSTTQSISRVDGADTDDNSSDFVAETPSPTASGIDQGGDDSEEPGETTPIAQIQGTGASSPLTDRRVTTEGIVTAAYPTGGFRGYYIQTPGSGGELDESHVASDALFVYSDATVGDVRIGDHVEVTGTVTEYQGLTELTVAAGGLEHLDDTDAAPVTPAVTGFPATDAEREALEGMLVQPEGDYTVTEVYDTNKYAEVALAASDTPLVTPTALGAVGSDEYVAAQRRIAEELVVLDDGASIDFLPSGNGGNKDIPLPYLTGNTVRVGEKTTFTQPVILDYRNSAWKFQPTTQLTVDDADEVQPVEFEDNRQPEPKLEGGDIRLATFNVLNYFPTTGDSLDGCTYYADRTGDPVSVSGGCDVRGAAEEEDFERQQAKIVTAINGLDADVVSLEEIENSAEVGHDDRDFAVANLVDALNDAEGADVWAYDPSPTTLPAREDVIRTAFIYRKATIELVGDAQILDTANFGNARQPHAQGFKPKEGGGDDAFVVVANHLKSKGNSTPAATGDNADLGDGVGAFNGDRTRQAEDMVDFAEDMADEYGTDKVYLVGDFNSYAAEDPIAVVTDAGYIDQGALSGKHSYNYDAANGSLDYIFASPAASETVADSDIWNINSAESVALEYSRYNYNATNLYTADQYRSSDHDPVLVGIDIGQADGGGVKELNLLNINDFHGRIDDNTVKFAGTIEQLRAEYPDSTALLSDGDNIGASLFASSVQQDQPTIDVLNALDLRASSVGNHEFDQGYDDLAGRVADAADFDYLAANVTKDGEPVLDPYTIIDVDGVKVGVIGAVTQETPALVSPGGIDGLEFGDPVDAVNAYAEQLSDGDGSNDEADVIVAEYHEGSGSGDAEGADLDAALADGGVFEKIVDETSEDVDVIFNGHTHAQYAWTADAPGGDGTTRPVLQTGSYGENVGQVVLEYDTETGEAEATVNRNVARVTTDDDALVAEYPAVAEVKEIVDEALANAAEVGDQVIGEADGDITTAFVGDTRDDRTSESTLGNFVADAMLATLSSADRGGAEIGIVNPGGLRAELYDGEITYAEANAVLPFLNNLWTTSLTGAQVKTALEQQWQRDAHGDVPSTPYLQLGLSKNVSYTFDGSRPEGDRVTSITVNGDPIDMDREYRVGSFSFLLQGGDNFRVFAEGKDTKDTGLVDRDAWIEYITANSPISPSYDRRSVQVSGLPEGALPRGEHVELEVSKLDLTSLGAPVNTELSATFGAAGAQPEAKAAAPAAVTAPVVDGAATVAFDVPSDLSGEAVLTMTAKESGTTVTLPLRVTAADDDTPGQDDDDDTGDPDSGDDTSSSDDGSNDGDGSADGDGSDDGNASGSDEGTADGDLAVTGADPWTVAAVAVVALALVAGGALLARRSRPTR